VRGLARSLVALACAAPLVACGGGGGGGGGELDDTLGYLPDDAGLVVVVSTDLESEQLRRLDRKIVRPASHGDTLEDLLREAAEDARLSYDEDLKPLLGNPLAVGTQSAVGPFGEGESPGFTAAIETRDGDKLREVVEKVPGLERDGEESGADLYAGPDDIALAIEGDTLVLAQDRITLRRALEQHDSSGRLTSGELDEALADLPEDAFVRVRGSVDTLLALRPEAARLRSLPWVAALRTVGIAASFPDDDHLVLEASLNTDEVSDDDLPIAPGAEAPEIARREGEIAGANRDQSRTTVFLLRAARALFPDSRFVRAVDSVEQDLGIDFEDEILRQFNGPSVSTLTFDGQSFAARSEVRDPDRLREQLRVLAPRLPQLVEGLDGLRSQGLALLLLFAPDAPVTTEALGQVQVESPTGESDLYHVSGLSGDGPSDLYFGVIGDVFVVGSDEERARSITDAPTEQVEGAHGAAVTRFDAREGTGELLDRFGIGADFPVGEVVGSLEASSEQVRATLRVELPG
jgi:hypothetical protein